LVDSVASDPSDVALLVAINPRLRGLEVVDGFHRLAAHAAAWPARPITCHVVSEIVA
jgi:hypothetical protein